MPPTEHSPLLAANNEVEDRIDATEDSPLLADNEDSQPRQEQQDGQERQSSSSALWPRRKSAEGSKKSKWRWPSIAAGAILVLLVVAVLVGGFVMPGAVKEYAEGAAVIEPTGLSVESITTDGVRARIQANFRLDGSRVDNVHSRRLGRFATGIMRKLETSETNVNVYLPHYDNSLLGSAVVPPITVDLRDGHTTAVDFVTDLTPGDAEQIKKIANNWLEGKLDQLKVTGAAQIQVKSGIFPLGAHDVVESMVFEASKIPSVPKYNIERLTFMDVPMGRDGRKAVGANVSLALHNDYHVGLNVPPLGFEILLANCDSSDPYITVAEAVTDNIEVRPLTDVHAGALGIIRKIPKSLVRSCPKSNMSPLDHFMGRYLRGEDAEIYVRGNKIEDSDAPEWIASILRNIMVPIEFPGHSFGNVIRNFSATDVNFQMGSPFADPNDPEGVPHVSGTIQVIAALPEEFDLDLGVQNLRSDAELFYKGKKLGNLNMEDWNPANSTRVTIDNEVMMNITSRVLNVPLDVTDNNVFTDILQKMFFGDGDILLTVEANVDVQVGTVLGHVDLKGIPANGTIPVKTMPRDTLTQLLPQVDNIQILNTSHTGVTMEARVNFTNPTPYTAQIPYVNLHILNSGSLIGEAIATDVNLTLGNNTGNIIRATWDPWTFGGDESQRIAKRLLSEYLSGENTTLEVRTHRGTIPSMPLLGEGLSKLNVTIPTPRLRLPHNPDGDEDGDDGGDDDRDRSRFIQGATFHIFSSTATFTLASPLHHDTVYIEYINATAFYNHTEPIGQIVNDQAFPAPPGLTVTPKLPVEWSPSHIGYGKLKEALGGRLKLDAEADVRIRLGSWVEEIHYIGHGIGAKVSL